MGKIIYTSLDVGQVEISMGVFLSSFSVAFAIAIAVYLLRSIGLYTLAKRNGVKNPGLAWIPGFWVYTMCLLIAEYRFFGKTYKSLAVIFAVIAVIAEVISLATTFITYFPVVGYFLSGGVVYLGDGTGLGANAMTYWTGDFFVGSNMVYPYKNPYAIINLLNYLNYFSNIINFAIEILKLNAFIALFRKFAPRHYIVMAIVSFFGLFPIFVFAIRKNRPIDYASYMRTRYTYYANPNPQNYTSHEKSPFEDYPNEKQTKVKDEDPFDEFSDK